MNSYLAQSIHNLIGCSWGRGVATRADSEPCPEQAVRIIVLHAGPNTREVRLCQRHLEIVMQETTPHDFSKDQHD